MILVALFLPQCDNVYLLLYLNKFWIVDMVDILNDEILVILFLPWGAIGFLGYVIFMVFDICDNLHVLSYGTCKIMT